MSRLLVVTGTRSLRKEWVEEVVNTLTMLHHDWEPDYLMEGGALGVDKQARYWATNNGVQPVTLPALWDHNRKSAGPIRNRKMVKLAVALQRAEWKVLVAAFPGPSSKGTFDMRAACEANDLTCLTFPLGAQLPSTQGGDPIEGS